MEPTILTNAVVINNERVYILKSYEFGYKEITRIGFMPVITFMS